MGVLGTPIKSLAKELFGYKFFPGLAIFGLILTLLHIRFLKIYALGQKALESFLMVLAVKKLQSFLLALAFWGGSPAGLWERKNFPRRFPFFRPSILFSKVPSLANFQRIVYPMN